MSFINLVFLNKNIFLISIKIINLSESNRQLTIKFLSGRLNIKLYNKLSKEIKDFKDLYNKYIYTQH